MANSNTYIRDGFVSAGSAQITGSLGVTGGITGSLQGTASYATQALSASYAPGGGSGTVNSGVAGYVAYYPTTTTTVDDTNGLYWDQTNSRLGIGTASPSFPISLEASLGNKIGIYDVGSGAGYGFGIQSSLFQVFTYTSGDDISFGYGNSGTFNRNVTFKGTGNVGIGTASPARKLTVVGDIGIFNDGSDSIVSNLYIGNAANTRAFNFQPNAAGTNLALWGYNSSNNWQNLVNFNYDGNVGIGTTTPSAKLDVNGNVRITGSLLVNGTSLVAGYNPTPLAGTIQDGITSVLGSLNDWDSNFYQGTVLYSETAGGTITFGQLCYRTNAETWALADATAIASSATHMLGICVKSSTATNPTSILINGFVETTNYATILKSGEPLYMATTAGSITKTAPTTAGNIVRLIGNTFWDSNSQEMIVIHFNPDRSWIEL